MAKSATHAPLSADDRALLSVAARSIQHGLAHGVPLPVESGSMGGALAEPGACFVTLAIGGQLRGCVGSIMPRRPLANDVAENAFAAAFRDTRFEPLRDAEIRGLSIEVSVLSPLVDIEASSDTELARALRPGFDGLVLRDQAHRAVFLPQVWEQLPVPADFIAALKRKAGIDVWEWPPDMKAERFTVREIGPQSIGEIA